MAAKEHVSANGRYGSHFWATVCKKVRPIISDRCPVLSCLSVCDLGVLWPNGWMDQDATWYGGRPRPRPHCVRWGPSSPKRGTAPPPIFGPCLLWPNGSPSQLLLSTVVLSAEQVMPMTTTIDLVFTSNHNSDHGAISLGFRDTDDVNCLDSRTF